MVPTKLYVLFLFWILGFIFLWKIPFLKRVKRPNETLCKLSIIIPARNGERTLVPLLSSISQQTLNGLGLMVAALGKTEAQVNSLSVLLAITLSALGGMMVPTFVMPDWMKTLSLFTPHAWALAGYHDVIIRGLGVKHVLKEMYVLAGFAGFFFAIALWRFRFDD